VASPRLGTLALQKHCIHPASLLPRFRKDGNRNSQKRLTRWLGWTHRRATVIAVTMSGKGETGPDTPADERPHARAKDARARARRRGTSPTPHDALFRAVLSDPARAHTFLRDHLPNGIAGQLADRPPRILDGSFVDEALLGSQSDLLMEVETAAGRPAFIYALLEHKSYPDPGTVLQLAGYMIRIWLRHAQGRAERLRNLPPIIPMVLYSGKSRWTVPDGLAETIAGDDPALVFLPGERFIFRWLTEMAPEELSSDAVVRAGFVTLTRRALTFLRRIVGALAENPVLQRQVIEYILQTYPDVRLDDLSDGLSAAGGNQMEELMGTIAETLRAEGRAEGRAWSLIRVLESRFGSLPQGIRDRIAGADPDQLDAWLDRVLDAGSLDSVFSG